jgi:hypothetical protein
MFIPAYHRAGTYSIQGGSTYEDAGCEEDREEERGQGREDA